MKCLKCWPVKQISDFDSSFFASVNIRLMKITYSHTTFGHQKVNIYKWSTIF